MYINHLLMFILPWTLKCSQIMRSWVGSHDWNFRVPVQAIDVGPATLPHLSPMQQVLWAMY